MKKTNTFRIICLSLFSAVLLLSCERSIDDLEPVTFPAKGEIFIDGFTGDLEYDAFGGSDVRSFEVDMDVKYKGTASMRFDVPNFNDPAGAFAGGVFSSTTGRDLSGFNTLSFYARSSKTASVDIIGFGNDLGENKFQTTINGLQLKTGWTKYYIPIPDPSKLTAEEGLFFFSEGPENDEGYTFWVDEVRFENLGTIAYNRSFIMDGEDVNVTGETGETYDLIGYAIANLPNGIDQRVEVSAAYFEFTSSDPSVASVDASGKVTILDAGPAVITASLAGVPSQGSLNIQSLGAPLLPETPAPVPTAAPQDVISVFSNAYTDVPVDFYNGYWQFSTTQSSINQVAGDDIIRYTQLNFVGIQFTAPTIDASDMTDFHIDIWTPEAVGPGTQFKILLFDVGADGEFGTGDDSSHELTVPSASLATGSWVSLDLPFSSFPGLTSRDNLAQIVLSGDIPTVIVDNMYFYKQSGGGPTEPSAAAPTPSLPQGNVISLFSDAYNDVPVDTWRTIWSSANFEDVLVDGNATKKYTALDVVGIETVTTTVDASNMTHFHLDVWSGDFTFFAIKLVDFGADGVFGGGDDVEHQIEYSMPSQGEWISYDIPLSDFTGLTTTNNIAQYILVGQPTGSNTVFVDNVYFHN